MQKKTQGQYEAEFARAMVQFEKEYLGRGPADVRVHLIEDMILVRLFGILTPAEQKLAETKEGQLLVKETRRQLFETSRPLLEEMVLAITGCRLISLHTDMSTRTGERVVALIVDGDLGQLFR
jgi:uncharacterized protein YbcI